MSNNKIREETYIIFLTGASGAGKTTLLNPLKGQYDCNAIFFLNFDSIGVPSKEEMIKNYGTPSKWQRAMTSAWVEIRISRLRSPK